MEKQITKRKFTGVVVSTKDKTISVLVETIKMNSKYKKQYKSHRKYAVHDENMIAKIDDKVAFEECRPISKTKKWRLVEILTK